jgi:ABC-2 type transport system ATP-binding protein
MYGCDGGYRPWRSSRGQISDAVFEPLGNTEGEMCASPQGRLSRKREGVDSMSEAVSSGGSAASGAGDVVIETRNLSKTYRDFWGRSKKAALKSLDLEVRKGEIFGLLGPNGSGKTTTLKLLLGLIFPTTGQALMFGRDATDVSKNERIGYLPEESYLYKFLDAEETLDFYGRLFDMSPQERKKRTAALIEMVGLTRDRKRQLKEYSKGMTRRIGVAQALINDPELVLLDEPTSGLDPIGTREMKNLIIELKERGKTVVLCSHLLADVEDVCDRIAVLHQGELKELGRVGDLLRVTDITQIRARGLSSQAVEQIRGILAAEQAAEVEIGNPNTTLEDLFLEIVKDTQARPGRRAQPQAAAASESQHSESRSPSHGA